MRVVESGKSADDLLTCGETAGIFLVLNNKW